LPRCHAHRGYDGPVSEPDAAEPASAAPPPAPRPPTPGERRLAHPPSDRYRAAEERAGATEAEGETDRSASVARGVALAVVVAAVGAAAIVVLGGILTMTAGLVVVAAAVGWGVALALRFGAGSKLAGSRRAALAVVITLIAVGAAQLGLWQYAQLEGGVLGPLDYLWEVFGVLVPIEIVVAVGLAWVVAR
jgi:hypothetical protein